VQIERLSNIDDYGRGVEICSDARQLAVGKLTYKCSIDVQLNANGSVKIYRVVSISEN